MSVPVHTLNQLTTETLTEILAAKGHLESGRVLKLQNQSGDSVHALNARLLLSYSPDATGTRPERLFAKYCQGPTPFGDSEVRYYTVIGADMPDPPMPTCYHSAYDATTGSYLLLLADLSETHSAGWEAAPTWQSASKAVDAMAQLHAHFWADPRLPEMAGPYPDEAIIQTYVAQAAPGLQPLLAEPDLSPLDRELIAAVFAQHPERMIQRARQTRDLTCVHGDLNPGNLLTPHAPDGRAYLIDCQPFAWSLKTWLGVSDLAYMMVHWWDPEIRRSLEQPLLRRYHERLLATGIDYSWNQLWDDYRLCAMQSLYVVAGRCGEPLEREAFRWLWWPQLLRTLKACHELNCFALL